MTREPSTTPGAEGDDDLGEAALVVAGAPVTAPLLTDRPGAARERERALGTVYSLAAFLVWGFLPLYFVLLAPTGPWELVALRIILSLVFYALLLAVTRTWRSLLVVVRQPRLLGLTAIAGALIYINWQVFIIGTLSGHVIETSLGYFITPIVTVLLGVIVLRERLRSTQWVAIGIATLAVAVIVVAYGSFPWIALTLAVSFGFYGLVKRRVGPSVDAISGLRSNRSGCCPSPVCCSARSPPRRG